MPQLLYYYTRLLYPDPALPNLIDAVKWCIKHDIECDDWDHLKTIARMLGEKDGN